MSFALLLLRLVVGGLLAGHGAQKLFGWFGGHGPRGTAGWLESLGLRPGKPWAVVAGASEFLSGMLTALGLLHPLGPLGMLAPMGVALGKVHWGRPIWTTKGGGELPAINAAVALALAASGPGAYSLDRLLGIRVPPLVAGIAGSLVGAGLAVALIGVPERDLAAAGRAVSDLQGSMSASTSSTERS